MTSVQAPRSVTPRPDERRPPVVWFPLLWDLTDRHVVVVGGGATAEAKILLLIEAGARVTVIAPTVNDQVESLVASESVGWLGRPFRSGDLQGAVLAIAATDNEEVNTVVFAEAEARGIPINAVDDPERCSVIFPAVHRDGPLVVAVSTSGAAPAVAVRLRDRIARLTVGYGRWLEALRGFRHQIRTRFSSFAERRDVWYRIADSVPSLDASRAGDNVLAERMVQDMIDDFAGPPVPPASPAGETARGVTTLLPRPRRADSDPRSAADSRISSSLIDASAPVVTCSMQLGGLVLIHLLRRHQADIPVVFVDTGYHFPETLAFRDQVAADWGLNLVVAAPETTVGEHETEMGRLHGTEPARCCQLRKVGPAEAVLAVHDLWFAAVRRNQGTTRVELEVSTQHQLSTGQLIRKVHPLADWSWADIDLYATRHHIPRHPLYEQGYTSIGCEPCTLPTFGVGDDRGGRWDGTEVTECGLHFGNGRGRGA